MNIIVSFFFPVIGYLSGSLPFAIWITRLAKGVDVRDAGSGHATATNTIRQAGFGWGGLVLMLDIAKGFIPIYLALRLAQDSALPYILPITAACIVIGHCWPVFAQFRGGMGLATMGGALLAMDWFAFVLALGLLLMLTITLRHGARASVITGILVGPLLLLFGLRGVVIWMAVAMGVIIAYRSFSDWNRKYRELWLDREKKL